MVQSMYIILYFFNIQFIPSVWTERQKDAKADICSRYPTSPLCQNSAQNPAQNPTQSPTQNPTPSPLSTPSQSPTSAQTPLPTPPANSTPPVPPSQITPSPSDVKEYCKQYLPNYNFYCTSTGPGSGTGGSTAAVFCSKYPSICNVPVANPPSTTNQQAYCDQYLPNYRYYCTGPGSGTGGATATVFCTKYPTICSGQAANPPTASNQQAYCDKYLPNYRYYCAGPGNGGQQSVEFCSKYPSICNIPPPSQNSPTPPIPGGGAIGNGALGGAGGGQPGWGVFQPTQQQPELGSQEMCNWYQYAAQSSCLTPLTETTYQQFYCNYYRQFCLGAQVSPGLVQAQPQGAGGTDPRCGIYYQQFVISCVRQPVTVATVQLCQSYLAYCPNYQPPPVVISPTAPAPALLPQSPQPSPLPQQPSIPQAPQTPQGPAPAPAPVPTESAGGAAPQPPPGVSQEQVQQLCTKYKSLALQYCKGNEFGRVKTLCDQYRQYCISS